ncbi:uncharacterized protein SCDLUD_001207 [Saccharomycodes ludwigii]|uniref:uncharacterized protein n=1 Tax=Saccharomycodes ludwigii TaxID=36035 RepID=UPI001E86A241|nr:hypothetical protein SCDLUD_001207 [Saccharomycodes ludwigii]KAH3903565.1 hypothetical protein SCDLUD_001207 [Saccharomycodes ludwigii]
MKRFTKSIKKKVSNQQTKEVLDKSKDELGKKLTGSNFQTKKKKVSPGTSNNMTTTPTTDEAIFSHANLIKQVNINRKHSEKYYIYDFDKYIGPTNENDLYDTSYNIFKTKNGVNPTSARYVIHYLTKYFKTLLVENNTNTMNNVNSNVNIVLNVWESLTGISESEKDKLVCNMLVKFFPWEGCSLNGEILEDSIKSTFQKDIILVFKSLLVLWSKMPKGVIPWKSYIKFTKLEKQNNFPMKSFYQYISLTLPDHNYTCCCFEFFELVLAVISNGALLLLGTKDSMLYWLFHMAQYCFPKNIVSLETFQDYYIDYQVKAESLYHVLVAYMRSLYEEKKLKDFYLIEDFNILTKYPPEFSSLWNIEDKALILSVPSSQIDTASGLFETCSLLVLNRRYEKNVVFTKLENDLLDRLHDDPVSIYNKLFTENSKKHVLKMDPHFKICDKKTGSLENINNENDYNNKNRQHSDVDDNSIRNAVFEKWNQYGVADWIGFESDRLATNLFFKSLENASSHDEGDIALVNSVGCFKMEFNDWLYLNFIRDSTSGFINKKILIFELNVRVNNFKYLIIVESDLFDENDFSFIARKNVSKADTKASGRTSKGKENESTSIISPNTDTIRKSSKPTFIENELDKEYLYTKIFDQQEEEEKGTEIKSMASLQPQVGQTFSKTGTPVSVKVIPKTTFDEKFRTLTPPITDVASIENNYDGIDGDKNEIITTIRQTTKIETTKVQHGTDCSSSIYSSKTKKSHRKSESFTTNLDKPVLDIQSLNDTNAEDNIFAIGQQQKELELEYNRLYYNNTDRSGPTTPETFKVESGTKNREFETSPESDINNTDVFIQKDLTTPTKHHTYTSIGKGNIKLPQRLRPPICDFASKSSVSMKKISDVDMDSDYEKDHKKQYYMGKTRGELVWNKADSMPNLNSRVDFNDYSTDSFVTAQNIKQ